MSKFQPGVDKQLIKQCRVSFSMPINTKAIVDKVNVINVYYSNRAEVGRTYTGAT